jgi:hypothetical protein
MQEVPMPEEITAAETAVVSVLTEDRPISTAVEDKLRRNRFASEVAKVVRLWHGRDSLVVALYGPWGSGKTSIKNMIVQSLQADSNPPYILEFDPWQWSGHQNLATAYFKEISRALGRENRDSKPIQLSLKKYSAFLGVGKHLLSGVPIYITLAALAVGAMGIGTEVFSPKSNLSQLLSVLSYLALIVGALLSQSSVIIQSISEYLEADAEASAKTLADLKHEISVLLRDLKRPFVVVIDDIDRLPRDEVRTIFQLVKANADFPNFIYLLPMQRSVEKALDDYGDARSGEFLEKIVQISFDLPPISQIDIDRILSAKLATLFPREIEAGFFGEARWIELYHGHFRSYFSDLRDINRFIATLAFQIELLRANEVLEVNLVDFVGIEALRTFEPELHSRLKSAKRLLTRAIPSDKFNRDAVRTEIEKLYIDIDGERRRRAVDILKVLFPNRQWAFENNGVELTVKMEWLGRLQICCAEFYDRYFHLDLIEKEVTQYEINLLLAGTGNRRDKSEQLAEFAKDDRLTDCIMKLEPHVGRVAPDAIETLIGALFDAAEDLPLETDIIELGRPEWAIQRMTKALLLRIEGLEDREQIMNGVIADGNGISMAVMRIALDSEPQQADDSPPWCTNEIIERLKFTCLARIRRLAVEGKLLKQRFLPESLLRWAEWSSPGEVISAVGAALKSDQDVCAFLRQFVGKATSTDIGSRVSTVRRFIKLDSLENIVDVKMLTERVDSIDIASPKLSADDILVIAIFTAAVERKKSGKGDKSIFA